VNHQAVDMYEGEWLESVLMMLACHGMQGDAESSSIITAATKMDNIAVPMIDKKWLCNDELLWDPGVRLKVVMGHGRHDDHIHDDEGNGFSLKLCNKKVFYSVKLLLFL
jgi:hypothetical protein